MAFYMTRYIRKAKLGFFWNLASNFSTQTQTQTAVKVDKGLLTKLRGKTGFSFFKCNNALKLSNNNFKQAEDLLNEQAENEGWAKAQKLKTRSTSQGLVGVLTEGNYASLVQIGCETDFVARNDLFQELVSITAQSTLNFRRNIILQNLKINSFANEDISHLREILLPHEVQTLSLPNDKFTIEEHVVNLVGKIGENIKVKKALAIATNQENIIGISSHGNISTTLNNCIMGTYCAAVILKPLKDSIDKTYISNLARSLSQHVIGMNPTCLNLTEDIPEEDTLLCQEFLLDAKKNVGDILKQADVEIVDFIRYSIED